MSPPVQRAERYAKGRANYIGRLRHLTLRSVARTARRGVPTLQIEQPQVFHGHFQILGPRRGDGDGLAGDGMG